MEMKCTSARRVTIEQAKFGNVITDYPFLFGLYLSFRLGDGTYISDGGRNMVNISKDCKWSSDDRKNAIEKMVDDIRNILIDAKADDIHDLIGKPVEVELDGNTFKSFRILTEVL